MAQTEGLQGKPKTCADSDETDGKGGYLQEAENYETGPWTQDISIFIARFADHSTQPSLGN